MDLKSATSKMKKESCALVRKMFLIISMREYRGMIRQRLEKLRFAIKQRNIFRMHLVRVCMQIKICGIYLVC